VRFGLVLIVAATYATVLALVTWQALRGQSIVNPDAATLASAASIAAATLAAVIVVVRPRRAVTAAPAA